MQPRQTLALVLLYTLSACARAPDDRITPEQWGSPSTSPRFQKATVEQRLAFNHYRSHLLRLNRSGATGLPGDITWDEAIARGTAMRVRERDAVRLLSKAIGDPGVRVTQDVFAGQSGAVCGWIGLPPPPPRYDRPFVVLASDEVIVAPSAEEFAADEPRAAAEWRRVGRLLDQCELDTQRYQPAAIASDPVQDRRAEIAAINAAGEAGKRGDRNALRQIIEQRSDRLLESYWSGFSNEGLRITPEIEGILVLAAEQQHEPKSWPLVMPSWPKCTTRYGTPAMRAALLQFAQQSRSGLGVRQFLCGRNDGATDADALALLSATQSPAASRALVEYLQIRRPPGTVMALVAKHPTLAGTRETAEAAASVYVALLGIGTSESLAAYHRLLAALTARRDDAASAEAAALLLALTQSAYGARADRGSLLALWAAFPQRDTRQAFARWATFYDVTEAAPLLLRGLEDSRDPSFAFDILRIGRPEDWKRVDAWSHKATRDRPIEPALRKAIDDTLADLARAQAEQVRRRQDSAWYAATHDDILEEDVANHDRMSDPAAYLAWQRARLARREAASREFAGRPAAKDLARQAILDYAELAGYARWMARDPRSAIELWEIVSREHRKEKSPLGLDPFEFAIADTLRFDMDDPQGAAKRLEALRERLDAQAGAAFLPWLDAELAALKAGKAAPAAGDLACAVPGFFFTAGGFPGIQDLPVREITGIGRDPDPARVSEAFESLTPSIFHVFSTFHRWPVLGSPERVVKFAKRHDPSGFALSCAMRLVQWYVHVHAEFTDATTRQRNLPQWSDADFATMSKAAALVVGAPPAFPTANAALASPERTWDTFIAALRRGDADAARACLGAEARSMLEPLFKAASRDELRAMAQSFTRFELSSGGESVREAVVTRNGRTGIVSFVKQGKEWRIASM